MGLRTAPSQVAGWGSGARPLLQLVLLAALLSAAAALAKESQADLSNGGLWHYAILAEDNESTEVVWRALPMGDSSVTYAIQRWPTAGLPLPGQNGYLNSLVRLEITHDSLEGTFTAVDGSPVDEEPSRPFYRIVALASSGEVLAASQPAQAAISKGNVFVSTRSCGGGPCRKLLQQKTIQSAIKAAAPGATVNVLPGTYTGEGNTNLEFEGKAITLQAPAGPNATIIDCQYKARAFVFTAKDGRNVQIKGFGIQNGASDSGGCIWIENGSPTITDCTFKRCLAATDAALGGAVFVDGADANPLIQGCRFFDGTASHGGGIHAQYGSITIQNCFFEGNQAIVPPGLGGSISLISAKQAVIRDIVATGGRCVFAGGGISIQLSLDVLLERVKVTRNHADNFGGAALILLSKVQAFDSELSDNTALVFGGAIQAQYSLYNATRVKHINNSVAFAGGGAINIVNAAVLLKDSLMSGNTASYGGGFNLLRLVQPDLGGEVVPTIISANDTVFEGNIAKTHGGAFFIDSADTAAFINCTVSSNIAANRGGGGYCSSTTPVQVYQSTISNNTAATGGGLFAAGPCNFLGMGAIFQQNIAADYGAGIAVSDGSVLDISLSRFIRNGVSDCADQPPPVGGGAIFMGVPNFKQEDTECGADDNITLAQLKLNTVSFDGNLASSRGGALHVTAGTLEMDTVEFVNNVAVGSVNNDGVGGAIALDERCADSLCSPVVAQGRMLNITNNKAQMAGGGIFHNGSSTTGSLSVSEALFAANTVEPELQGMGAGLYLGRDNVSVLAAIFDSNSAYYGAGLFVSADLSRAFTTALLNFTGNKAAMGAAAFWLRSKSQAASFECAGCSVQPASKDAIATEALSLKFGKEPPSLVQSNQDFPEFKIELRDFYGNLMQAEKGTCIVTSNSSAAAVSSRGGEEFAFNGIAEFTSLQLKARINQTYNLRINFDRLGGPGSRFLAASDLPPLDFPITIASCKEGSQPSMEGNDCVVCSAGTYNKDGNQCLQCPKGAECLGGSHITARPDFWRSSSSSVEFYSCQDTGICLGGDEGGVKSCAAGHEGPLCDVCYDDYFKWNGKCKKCDGNTQAKLMLGLTIVAFTLVVVALFARDWEFGGRGPGIMTKIKILLTHFQMVSLFRDYDVIFPGATSSAIGWFELFNVSFSMLAPECFFGSGYNFYAYYISQMILPAFCVCACAAIYQLTELLLRRLDPTGTKRAKGVDSEGWIGWLEGLKIRCWKNAFWFVTLLYPRCAMTALQLFGWHKLDVGTYLKVDYSIMVKSAGGGFKGTFVRYMIPGIFMIIVFALIIPTFWFMTVYYNRHRLDDPIILAKYSFLYASYSDHYPYWETVEMLRKFSFAFIPVFIPTQVDGSLQAVVGQGVLLTYIIMAIKIWPFALDLDNWLQLASLTALWLVLLSAGVNKWAEANKSGSRMLAGIQLTLTTGVGLALFAAVFYSGINIVRRFSSRRRSEKASRAAKALMEKSTSNLSADGGSDGASSQRPGDSAAANTRQGSIALVPTATASNKQQRSAADGTAAGGPVSVRVMVGVPMDEEIEAGLDVRGTAAAAGRLRSAAEDAEMRLPVEGEGVQQSDPSTAAATTTAAAATSLGRQAPPKSGWHSAAPEAVPLLVPAQPDLPPLQPQLTVQAAVCDLAAVAGQQQLATQQPDLIELPQEPITAAPAAAAAAGQQPAPSSGGTVAAAIAAMTAAATSTVGRPPTLPSPRQQQQQQPQQSPRQVRGPFRPASRFG